MAGVIAAAGCLACASVRPAQGAVSAGWQDAVSGNWTDGSKWSTAPAYPNNGTPAGTTYEAMVAPVGPAGTNYTVTLNQNVTLDRLVVGAAQATVAQPGGTLTLVQGLNLQAGAYELSGGGTLSGGTISGSGGALRVLSGALQNTTLATDLYVPAGGQLSFAGAWANTGTVHLDGGSLILRGTFTRTQLGTVLRSAGSSLTIQTGTLDNTGATFALDATTGSWNIGQSGGIQGGTLAPTSGGAGWYITGEGATLDGVNVQADLTLLDHTYLTATNTQVTAPVVLTLAGGNLWAQIRGDLTLAAGTQVLFAGTGSGQVSIPVIGPGVTVRTTTGNGYIRDWNVPGLTNRGTISAETPGRTVTIAPLGGLTNEGVIQAVNGGILVLGLDSTHPWNNTGIIQADGLSTIQLGGDFTPAQAPVLVRAAGTTVAVTGNLHFDAQSLALDAFNGSWSLGAGGFIQGGTLVPGGGGLRVLSASDGTLDGVNLQVDVQVPAGHRLTLSGGWTNGGAIHADGATLRLFNISAAPGTLDLSNGTLDLANTFATSDVLTLPALGSNVAVVCSKANLNNTGATLPLSAMGGGWYLGSGGIRGGLITPAGGVSTLSVAGPATLDGVTIGAGATVNVRSGGALTMQGAWANQGTIAATDATVTVVTTPTLWGTFALSGGRLVLGGAFDGAAIGATGRSNTILTLGPGGVLNNVGGVFTLDAASPVLELSGGKVNGGTLHAGVGGQVRGKPFTATTYREIHLQGVTLEAPLVVEDGCLLGVQGGLTLSNQTITLQRGAGYGCGLIFYGAQMLGGTGALAFDGTDSTGTLYGAEGTLTVAAGVTVGTGAQGGVVNALAGLANQGTFRAGTAGKTLTVQGSGISNNGLFEAIGGGVLAVAGNLDGTGTVHAGAGSTVTAARLRQQMLQVEGRVQVLPGGVTPSVVSSLAIAKTGNQYTGTLDLTNTDLIIQPATGGSAAALADVLALLQAGSDGGAWDGPGITSSTARADAAHATALGVMPNDAGNGTPIYTTFGGASVDANSILIAYTWSGDVNLDGKVDGSDLRTLAQHYRQAGHWWQGDFNQDGAVNIVDLALLTQNWGHNVAPPPPPPPPPDAPLAIQAVPEPAGLVLLVLGGVAMLRRRRG